MNIGMVHGYVSLAGTVHVREHLCVFVLDTLFSHAQEMFLQAGNHHNTRGARLKISA